MVECGYDKTTYDYCVLVKKFLMVIYYSLCFPDDCWFLPFPPHTHTHKMVMIVGLDTVVKLTG